MLYILNDSSDPSLTILECRKLKICWTAKSITLVTDEGVEISYLNERLASWYSFLSGLVEVSRVSVNPIQLRGSNVV